MALRRPAQASAPAASAPASAPAEDKSKKFEQEPGDNGEGDEGNTLEAETRVIPEGEGTSVDPDPAAAAADEAGASEAVKAAHRERLENQVPLGAELTDVRAPVPAVVKRSALAERIAAKAPKIEDLVGLVHNNVQVDWNSLPNVKAEQGEFFLKEGEIALGKEMHMQLISTQDNFAVSPNVDDADAKQYVRYSDDGKMLKDGVTTVVEHLKILKDLGYTDAKCSARQVLVGEVTKCDGKPDLVGELIQLDIPPTSYAKFKTHKIQVGWKAAKGKVAEDAILMLKMTANPASGNGKKWTVVSFATSNVPASVPAGE